MYSVYDLAYIYAKKNNIDISNSKEMVYITRIITEVLNNGANCNDILDKIKSIKNNNNKDHSTYFKSIKPSGNLLKHDKFLNNLNINSRIFYHNELRLNSGPPVIEFDINTGITKEVSQEYFLEMRASYTLEELYNYVSKKEYLLKAVQNKPKTIGALRFLCDKYDVDYLLFLIDTTNDIYSCRLSFIKNILDVDEYETEAKENYRRRITECAISNADKIVYKRKRRFDNV